jgi:chromosome segregation ATPase
MLGDDESEEQTIEELKRQLEEAKRETEELESSSKVELDKQKSKAESALADLAAAQERIENLNEEIENSKGKRSSDVSEVNNLRRSMNEMNVEFSTEKEELYSINMQQQETIDVLESQLEEIKKGLENQGTYVQEDELAEQRSRAEKMESDLSYKTQQVLTLRALIEDLQGKHKSESEKFKEKVAEVMEEKAELSRAHASAPETVLNQAIETLENEKQTLAGVEERLSKQNEIQKEAIRALENAVKGGGEGGGGDLEMKGLSDDFEKSAALLANLYYASKNIETLAEQSSNLDPYSAGAACGEGEDIDPADFVREMMSKKQAMWWQSLDGIFRYSEYIDEELDRQEDELDKQDEELGRQEENEEVRDE